MSKCKGYGEIFDDYAYEYCKYRYGGEVDCYDCIFGPYSNHGAEFDPRINPWDIISEKIENNK